MKEKAYKLFHWLDDNHSWALPGLSVYMAKVNPETRKSEDDENKNTLVEYWFEGGPYSKDNSIGGCWSHDIRLDCGGTTYEEALVKYANLIKKHYGEESGFYCED